ncbi:hypothetical protein NP565_24090, partial [Vibrio parahaemolyticus]|nr:hypothetical protein [Vibrio parahaemolyticus]
MSFDRNKSLLSALEGKQDTTSLIRRKSKGSNLNQTHTTTEGQSGFNPRESNDEYVHTTHTAPTA